MKRFIKGLIIALVIVLSYGFVYGQDEPLQVIAKGIVPAEWGSLRFVLPKSANTMQLFFEDVRGIIRIVTITEMTSPKDQWMIIGNVPAIYRGKFSSPESKEQFLYK